MSGLFFGEAPSRAAGSEGYGESHGQASGGHSVVLRISELALGNGVAGIAQVASIETDFVAIEAIADADVNGRKSWCKCRIAFVQVPIADVLDDQVADDA